MNWRKYTDLCGEKMRLQLEEIAKHKTLSKDVFEIVSNSLAFELAPRTINNKTINILCILCIIYDS